MRKLMYSIIGLFTAVTLTAQVTIDRTTAPEPTPARSIELGSAAQFELKNGLKVFVVENHKLPRISMSLILDRDPIVEASKAGYVSIAGDMIGAGTANRSKAVLDEEVDFMGANFGTSASSIRMGGLSKYTDQLVDILSDVLLNPTFPQEEFDKLKAQMLSGLQANADDPDAISGNLRGATLYGLEHPFGEVMTEASVEAITVEDCKSYFDAYFRPNIAFMVIIGDITAKDAQKKLKKALKKWAPAEVPHHEYPKTEVPTAQRVVMVDKPSAVQSVVWLGNVIDLPHGHADIEPLRVANQILGGGMSGRLFTNLREDKAFTYGAYSNFGVDELNATFGASAKVRNEVTDSAITEFLNEIGRMRTEAVSEDDLIAAKASLSGSFGRSLESPASAANFALNIARYDLSADYYNNYLARLDGVTAEDVLRVSNQYMDADHLTITVVGKAQDVAGKLSAFGAVEYFDANGAATDAPTFLFMPDGVTKETVVNAFFNAIGGAEAFQNIKELEQEMSLVAPGMPGAVSMYSKKIVPSYYVTEQSMQGMTLMKVEYKDGAANSSGMRGNATLEGDELASTAKEAQYVISELAWLDDMSSITFDGQTLMAGKDVYQITDGDAVHYFDVATGLLHMSTETTEGPEGDVTVTTVYDSWQEVNGLTFVKSISQSAGPQSFTVTVDKVTWK
ncbi:MAG: insulinase family protein [Schleiferiaceae bacterium]|nr:insulinase family protein [Schleiferiaceae bacterium]